MSPIIKWYRYFYSLHTVLLMSANTISPKNNSGANMSNSPNNMDAQEKEIDELYKELDPQDEAPVSLAEATTAPLDNDAIGRHTTQADSHGGN